MRLGQLSPWLATLLVTALASSLPRLRQGRVPSQPVSGRDGAFTLFEVGISPAGNVVGVEGLGGSTRLAETVRDDLLGWKFEPETNENGESVSTSVLVAVVSRSPSLGGAIPPLPKAPAPAEASSGLAYPKRMTMPALPPQASVPGVVLLEVTINEEGKVSSAGIVRSSDHFDDIALDTVETWSFAPATRNGRAIAARAYVLFSFRPAPRLR